MKSLSLINSENKGQNASKNHSKGSLEEGSIWWLIHWSVEVSVKTGIANCLSIDITKIGSSVTELELVKSTSVLANWTWNALVLGNVFGCLTGLSNGVVQVGTAVAWSAASLISTFGVYLVASWSSTQTLISNCGCGCTYLVWVVWNIFGKISWNTSVDNCLSSISNLGGNWPAATVCQVSAWCSLVGKSTESRLGVPDVVYLSGG